MRKITLLVLFLGILVGIANCKNNADNELSGSTWACRSYFYRDFSYQVEKSTKICYLCGEKLIWSEPSFPAGWRWSFGKIIFGDIIKIKLGEDEFYMHSNCIGEVLKGWLKSKKNMLKEAE